MSLSARVALQQAEKLLVKSAQDLRARLEAGDDSVRSEYCELLRTLAAIAPATAPGSNGELISTAQMAERLGLSPKALLRRKKNRDITPTLQRGKLIRWSGRESL